MRIRVLGRIEIDDGSGVATSISSPRMRLLLAILVANRHQAVPLSRLMDLIWPHGPPATAKTSIQGTVSRLRKIMEPHLVNGNDSRFIQTGDRGYRLMVSREELDLAELEERIRMASESGTDEAIRAMARAWARPILAEFESEPWAMPVVERIREERLGVIVRHATATIKAGKPEAVIPALTAELAADPHEERVAELLMTAVFRQGRRADALAIYATTRKRLVEDLGLEPTERLRKLELSILEHGPDEEGLDNSAACSSKALPVLLGRESELAGLLALVDDHQLVTIVGPGGTGKTSLAGEATRQLPRRRIVRVDLTPVRRDSEVLRTVANRLGVLEQPDADLGQVVAWAIDQAPTLLVLDNCETVLSGVADLVGSLPARVTVLCTSRRPLGLAREVLLRLGPLQTPAQDADLAAVAASTSCQLLVERSGVELTDENYLVLGDICRRLDGLPLALELGAYRLRRYGPSSLLEELEAGRDIEGPGDSPAEQRSLDALLEQSVATLSSDSRRVLWALSQFSAPISIEVLRLMLAKAPPRLEFAVRDLVDRSLVVEAGRVGGEDARIGLLETIRSYVRRRIQAECDEETWRSLHFDLVVGVVLGNSAPAVDNSIGVGEVASEIDAVLDYLEDTASDGQVHHQFVTKIGSYWYEGGRLSEAKDRMRRALDLYPEIGPLRRGVTLAAAGLMSFSGGEFRQLRQHLSEAIDLLGGIGVPGLGLLEASRHVSAGELSLASKKIETALASNDVEGVFRVFALDIAANAAWFSGQHSEALTHFEVLGDEAGRLGEQFFSARALRGRGLMMAYLGSPEAGALLVQESIGQIKDWEKDRGAAQCLAVRAAINMAFGSLDDARSDAKAVLRRLASNFDGISTMVALPVLATTEAASGQHSVVAALTGWSQGVCDSTGLYLPKRLGSQMAEAERQSQSQLEPSDWTRWRRHGAHYGLPGLLDLLDAPSSR